MRAASLLVVIVTLAQACDDPDRQPQPGEPATPGKADGLGTDLDPIERLGDSPSKIRATPRRARSRVDIDRELMWNFAVFASVSSSMAMRLF